MIQYIIIGVVLFAASVYAAFQIYMAIKHANDPCCGCAGCTLKEQIRKKNKGKKTKLKCRQPQ